MKIINCNDIPKEVIKKFESGATEVKHCGAQWNGNIKVIERQDGKVCARYHKQDIPDKCFKD